MRILIVGAGALGGLVGAYLTRSGEDVTLLEVNQARARLLADAGLHITRVGQDETTIPVHVVTSLDGVEPFDLVFVAVKTYQTEDAVRAALGASTAKTLFFSLQNGIGNAEAISALVGEERVLCGVTYHSIEHAGPGACAIAPASSPSRSPPCAAGRRQKPRSLAQRSGAPASRRTSWPTSTTRCGGSCSTTRW